MLLCIIDSKLGKDKAFYLSYIHSLDSNYMSKG